MVCGRYRSSRFFYRSPLPDYTGPAGNPKRFLRFGLPNERRACTRMKFRALGRTGLQVSLIGLGTMTFGEQNTEADGHAQLDYAVDCGVNLIDTAEVYAVPPRAETYGSTERIIGTWLRRSGKRPHVILCSKVAGPGRALGLTHVRGGVNRLDRRNIVEALDDSLRRLQTDYLDLYQVHWPDRSTNFFGRLGYEHVEQEDTVAIEETLEVLSELVQTGKVRYIGVSNETPWGLHRYLQLAHEGGLARLVSIQNPYSLLNRSFELGLAEIAIRENIGLLAYSPLGFGVLTGKYLDGARPPEGRLVRWARFARYSGDAAEESTAAYVALARSYGLDPAQMALSFVNRQRFVMSTLIGVTTMEQLVTNVASVDVNLSNEVIQAIEQIHQAQPNPCP
jgi:aryl-alcohol dehydrogenase-like predicted oxidoreductase